MKRIFLYVMLTTMVGLSVCSCNIDNGNTEKKSDIEGEWYCVSYDIGRVSDMKQYNGAGRIIVEGKEITLVSTLSGESIFQAIRNCYEQVQGTQGEFPSYYTDGTHKFSYDAPYVSIDGFKCFEVGFVNDGKETIWTFNTYLVEEWCGKAVDKKFRLQYRFYKQ